MSAYKRKARNATFSLNERMILLKFIKDNITIVDSSMNDFTMNQTKAATWESIQKQFLEACPNRHAATSRDIRELWRRMKHRARMEVRTKVQKARMGQIQGQNVDHRGWVPDNNQMVINVHDLGLDPDTRAITDFVPLLEEEATVLETRNGIVQGLTGSGRVILEGDAIDVDNHHANRRSPGLQVESVEELMYDDMIEESEDDVVHITSNQGQDEDQGRGQTNADQRLSVSQDNQHELHISHVRSVTEPSPSRRDDVLEVTTQPVIKQEPLVEVLPSFAPPPRKSPPSTTVLRASPLPPLQPPPPPLRALNSHDNVEAEVRLEYLRKEHEAKMALFKLKVEAAKAKSESARAKRAAYDEKRMYFFEKRKRLHADDDLHVT